MNDIELLLVVVAVIAIRLGLAYLCAVWAVRGRRWRIIVGILLAWVLGTILGLGLFLVVVYRRRRAVVVPADA